jgi:hypothetical protein
MAKWFRYQRLNRAQAAAIHAATAAGVSARSLAGEYGVSVRTIHRVRNREAEPVETVQVATWRADFAITDEGPVQVDQWRPA